MAIIKPESYKGAFPCWWEVRKVDEDRFNNISKVTLSLYHSIEAYRLDKFNNILYEVAIEVPGIGLTNDQITLWITSNHDRFKAGTDTDGSYIVNTFRSPVFIDDPNPDPVCGLKRSIEGIHYTMYLNADFLVLALRVHFYPNIDIPNPDPEHEGEFITQPSDEYDSSLDKEIAWVVDNNDQYEDSGVGELAYFRNLKTQGLTDEDILALGIQYGLQQGYINKRLYGIE